MSKAQNILVVGGGVAGLAVAIGLHSQGLKVEVVEKDASWSVYHVGIIVQSNFIRALDQLGLGKAAVAAGLAPESVTRDGLTVEAREVQWNWQPLALLDGKPRFQKVLKAVAERSGGSVTAASTPRTTSVGSAPTTRRRHRRTSTGLAGTTPSPGWSTLGLARRGAHPIWSERGPGAVRPPRSAVQMGLAGLTGPTGLAGCRTRRC